MESKKTIDVRGLSCPQPAMLTRQTLQDTKEGQVEALVDSGTARDNVARMAERAGWKVEIEEQPDGSFRLVLRR